MKRTSLVVAALLLLTAAPAGAAPLLDREPDCSQIPPEVQPSLALTSDPVLPVEVRVMHEPGDRPVVKEHMAVTRGAFERIGIKLRVLRPTREVLHKALRRKLRARLGPDPAAAVR